MALGEGGHSGQRNSMCKGMEGAEEVLRQRPVKDETEWWGMETEELER